MEFLGASGKKIVINAAPAEQAFALKNAIHSKLKIPKLNTAFIKAGEGSFMDKLKDMDSGDIVNSLAHTLLEIDSDEKVNVALIACFNSCTYDSERITQRTFDNVSAREDYYLVARECLKANLLPFYKGLISESKGLLSQLSQGSPA